MAIQEESSPAEKEKDPGDPQAAPHHRGNSKVLLQNLPLAEKHFVEWLSATETPLNCVLDIHSSSTFLEEKPSPGYAPSHPAAEVTVSSTAGSPGHSWQKQAGTGWTCNSWRGPVTLHKVSSCTSGVLQPRCWRRRSSLDHSQQPGRSRMSRRNFLG